MTQSVKSKNPSHEGATFLNLSKTLLMNVFHQRKASPQIKKIIPRKMQCGLVFQHLPESIHMVRHYEIIGEKCKKNIVKLVNAAKWK